MAALSKTKDCEYEQVVGLCKFYVWTYLVISIHTNIFFKGEQGFLEEQSAPSGHDTGFVVVFAVFCVCSDVITKMRNAL